LTRSRTSLARLFSKKIKMTFRTIKNIASQKTSAILGDMSDHQMIELREIMDKFTLSTQEAATLCGISAPTLKLAMARGLLPTQERCRNGILKFLRRSVGATARHQLRMEETS
jgi:hypothetical protein